MATLKGEQRKAELVKAAAEIVVDGGWAALNHRAVADRAGTSLGATTYYFTGLDELRRAVVDELVAADVARMEQYCAHLVPRRRSPRRTAELVVDVLTPSEHDELVAWYERYVQGARDPLFADAARRINVAARTHVDIVLRASGFTDTLSPQAVLAIVDGALIGSLAEHATGPTARTTAAKILTEVLAAVPRR